MEHRVMYLSKLFEVLRHLKLTFEFMHPVLVLHLPNWASLTSKALGPASWQCVRRLFTDSKPGHMGTEHLCRDLERCSGCLAMRVICTQTRSKIHTLQRRSEEAKGVTDRSNSTENLSHNGY